MDMDNKRVFDELEKEFGLRKNHILILDALSKDDYTADKLAKETGIPMGRIYEFLNDLLGWKLIDKKSGYPALYRVDNLERKVLDFIRKQHELNLEKEKRLLRLVEEKAGDQVDYITDREKYVLEDLRIVKESDSIKTIQRTELLPQILYPLEEEDFIKLRNFMGGKRKTLLTRKTDPLRIMSFRAMKEAYLENKRFVYVIDNSTLEKNVSLFRRYYGKRFPQAMADLISQLERYPKVKVLVTKHSLPIFVRMGSKRVLLGVSYFGSTLGVLIKSEKVSAFYENHFEELMSESVNVIKVIKTIAGA